MTSTHWSHQHFDLWSFLLNLRAHSLLLAVEWSKQKIVGPGLQVYRLATPMKTHENIVREHRTMSRETRPSFSPLPPPPETSYQSYVTRHRTKFDWTLRSHGTVPSLFTRYWRTRSAQVKFFTVPAKKMNSILAFKYFKASGLNFYTVKIVPS